MTVLLAVPPKPPDPRPRSPGWPKFRAAVVAAHPRCAACGSTSHLEVHHVKPFHLFPELELVAANCLVLCEDAGNCHFMIGHLKNWLRYNPTARRAAAAYLGWVAKRLPPG